MMMKGENNAIVKLIPSEERLMHITNLCLKFMIKKKRKEKAIKRTAISRNCIVCDRGNGS